jgi:hypothetical protein
MDWLYASPFLFIFTQNSATMFNSARLQQCFAGLVGFKQPSDPNYALIDADLTVSSSGRYIQTAHPLCTLENIYNTAPEFDKYVYPAWVAGSYSTSTVVVHLGVKYKANADVVLADAAPGISPKWTAIDPFSEYLRDIIKSSIVELTSDFLTAKKADETQRSIIDSLKLYDGVGPLTDLIIKHGRFVGFEITLSSQEGLQVQFDKLGFQSNTLQASLNFYLFHSSQKAPLKVFDLNIQTADAFAWSELADAILKFYDTHDTQGAFYFGYFESDLTGQAVRKIQNFTKPCLTCSSYDIRSYEQWSRYVNIRPVYFETSYLDGTNLPNLNGRTYASDTNWGMNLSMTVNCDLTEFFCKNKALVADALAMKISLKFLDVLAFNTRIGAIADKTKGLAMAELDDNEQSGSFNAKYFRRLKALSFDFSGLSSACMPHEKRLGITYSSI